MKRSARKFELKKLFVAIAVVDAVVSVLVLAACFGLGSLDRVGIGTAFFVGAVALALIGAGVGSGGFALPQLTPGRGATTSNTFALEMEAEDRNRHRDHDIEQQRTFSAALAVGLAGVPLLVVSILLMI